MMPYWARILLGVLLGAATGAALWLFVGTPWLTATAGALMATIGFLGSFFLWSADRLPEYEQVLFDRPNTIVAFALAIVFAGAGIGSGFLGGAAPSGPDLGDEMAFVYAGYVKTSDAFNREEADADTTVAKIEDLRAENERIAATLDNMPDRGGDLGAANEALATALQALEACASGTEDECLNARLAAADAQSALQRAGALDDEAEAEAA